MSPPNLFVSDASVDFWIWVNPADRRIQQVISGDSAFTSAGGMDTDAPQPPFVPNPAFTGKLSPFAVSVLHDYAVEHELETVRSREFADHPSRLNAIFLLPSEATAQRYARRHAAQVANRRLLRLRPTGTYRCSAHDSRWIDLLREGGLDQGERAPLEYRYWAGESAEHEQLGNLASADEGEPVVEVLYLGALQACTDEP
jgi:hypothetical protein